MVKNSDIDTFNRLIKISRETIGSLIIYEEMLVKANKSLNLIGNSTIKSIWSRHFLDSAQVIDLIDKNDNLMVDMGSGAGFPGLVIALLAKERKIPLKIKLIDKSPKKIKFLEQVITKLKLNVEAINENVFDSQTRFNNDVFIARAFKPLAIILELIHNKANNFKKFFIYLGKTGKKELLQASKVWDIEYKQRVSITSNDSIYIEINKLKKK